MSNNDGPSSETTSNESEQTGSELVATQPSDQQNAVDAERTKYQPTWAESFFSFTKALIIRALIVYFISSFFRRPQTNVDNAQSSAAGIPKVEYSNLYENGSMFDMFVYLSELETFKNFNNPEALIWHEEKLVYGDWYSGPNKDGTREFHYTFFPSEKLKNNGSIYLHVYTVKSDQPLVPKISKTGFQGPYVSYTRKRLNTFKIVKYKKTHNLLTGTTSASDVEIEKADKMKHEILSHWHPNLTINMVTDQTNWVQGHIPPPLDEHIHFYSVATPFNTERHFYKPVIYANDFWNLQRDYQPINSSVTKLELKLTYQPLSLLKWQLYLAQSMRKSWTSLLGDTMDEDDSDQDTLKETLLETNPYLLGLTVLISILHSIFEFLAFKNDIQFWNNRKSLEGLSVRSVFFNVFQSLIVLLYVIDNDTNTVVFISCFISLCIEIWKINKVVDISINREKKVLGIFPQIQFRDKGSYVESSTKDYDRLAFKYLSWALFPLLGGYAIYSLMYLEHKGWYSWVLSMLYGFLLTFGFIMMTPQLFINYKLKSVAHLPWRMMSYKFLNTFIDDIFAFIIKMPTLYRLGCFRDDIVFIIFLYQRWIYKTDHTRVNEFGFSGEMETQLAIEKQQDSPKDEIAKKTD